MPITSDTPANERNGYAFEHADFPGIESALDRAIALWQSDPNRVPRAEAARACAAITRGMILGSIT